MKCTRMSASVEQEGEGAPGVQGSLDVATASRDQALGSGGNPAAADERDKQHDLNPGSPSANGTGGGGVEPAVVESSTATLNQADLEGGHQKEPSELLFSETESVCLDSLRDDVASLAFVDDDDVFRLPTNRFADLPQPFSKLTCRDTASALIISDFVKAAHDQLVEGGDWSKSLEHCANTVAQAVKFMPEVLSKCALASQRVLDDTSRPENIRARLVSSFPHLADDLFQKLGGYKAVLDVKGPLSPHLHFPSCHLFFSSPHFKM